MTIFITESNHELIMELANYAALDLMGEAFFIERQYHVQQELKRRYAGNIKELAQLCTIEYQKVMDTQYDVLHQEVLTW